MATVTYNASLTWSDAMAANDLNSLANASGVLSSATAVDNTTNKYLYCDVSFIGGGSITPTAGGHLAVYMLPIASDGSTYPNASNGTASDHPAMTYFVGSIGFRSLAGTQVGVLEGVRIGPTKYKFYAVNKTGTTLTASGNVLKYATYTESVA